MYYRVLVIDLMLLRVIVQVMLLTWCLLMWVHLPLEHRRHQRLLWLRGWGQTRATWGAEGAAILSLKLEGSHCFHQLLHPQVSLSGFELFRSSIFILSDFLLYLVCVSLCQFIFCVTFFFQESFTVENGFFELAPSKVTRGYRYKLFKKRKGTLG